MTSEPVPTKDQVSDKQRREQLAALLAEWDHWQRMAVQKGWKLPGNSPLPRESWINYWKQCAAYERDPSGGRPVVPHRTGR